MDSSVNMCAQVAPTAQAVPLWGFLKSGSAPCKAQALRSVQTLLPLGGLFRSNCAKSGNDLILQAPPALLS